MPSPLRGWNASTVIKFLKQHGFTLHRTNGSHFHYKKQTSATTHLVTVAYHGSKNIPIGTMNAIVRQSGISREFWKQ